MLRVKFTLKTLLFNAPAAFVIKHCSFRWKVIAYIWLLTIAHTLFTYSCDSRLLYE